MTVLMTGCIQSGSTSQFETDLISLADVLDSCFIHDLDSIQSVSKTIRFSDREPETQNLEDYNILSDLELIRKYDVATPRWAEFVTESQKDSAGLTVTQYRLENERAPVRFISIVKQGDAVQSLKFYGEKKSLVSQQKLWMEWMLKSGYTMINESKLIFRKPSKFTMKVEY